MTSPNLHILTLTWQAADKLTRLKESLLPALLNLNYNWIIKDNNSQDGTIEIVEQWRSEGMQIRLITYPNNLENFSQGVNRCFQVTAAKDNDLILLLNNDVTFNDSTSLNKMIGLLRGDVGIVGARLLYTGTNKLQHAGVVFDPHFQNPFHYRTGQVSDVQACKNRYFQAVTGAVLLMRAGDFKQIHKNKVGFDGNATEGMDETYNWAFDDLDLCLSMHYNLGKKIVYCGQTNISHDESATLKKNPVNKLFLNHNLSYLKQKWGGRYILDKHLYEQNPNYNLLG